MFVLLGFGTTAAGQTPSKQSPLLTIVAAPQGAPVRCVAFAPDGKTIATGSGTQTSGEIRFYALPKGELRLTVKAPSQVNALAFSPDGKTLMSGTGFSQGYVNAGGGVQLWDVLTGKPTGTLAGEDKVELSVAFAPDGATVASAGLDGVVSVWDLHTRELKKEIAVGRRVKCVLFLPDGKTLVSGGGSDHSGDGDLVLWNVETGELKRALKGHTLVVNAAAVSPDGLLLASVGEDEMLKVWDTQTGELKHNINLRHEYSSVYNKFFPFAYRKAKAIAFSPDGKTFALGGSEDCMTVLWDVQTAAVKRILPGVLDEDVRPSRPVTAVAFSPEGKLLASGSEDGTVRLWRAD
jgi:WD40 repeat protein